jgi:hypothetical protein
VRSLIAYCLPMTKNQGVLGLSIGTRKIGTALITNAHLDCARVWVFPGRWNDKKLHKMLHKLNRKVHKYHITSITIKVPSATHHTIGLKALIAAIKEYCKDNAIWLHVCTIKELKGHGYAEGRKNKKILVQTLGDKYPRLYHKAQKEQVNRNQHYTKMFEAVAAAELMCDILSKLK